MTGVARAGSEMIKRKIAVKTRTSDILRQWSPPESSTRRCGLSMGGEVRFSCQRSVRVCLELAYEAGNNKNSIYAEVQTNIWLKQIPLMHVDPLIGPASRSLLQRFNLYSIIQYDQAHSPLFVSPDWLQKQGCPVRVRDTPEIGEKWTSLSPARRGNEACIPALNFCNAISIFPSRPPRVQQLKSTAALQQHPRFQRIARTGCYILKGTPTVSFTTVFNPGDTQPMCMSLPGPGALEVSRYRWSKAAPEEQDRRARVHAKN